MALNQIGAENLTVSTAGVNLTGVTGTRAARALIRVTLNPVRWRGDTAPTSTTGIYVAAGSYIDWTTEDADSMVQKVQFIRDTTAGGDATLEVAYFESGD